MGEFKKGDRVRFNKRAEAPRQRHGVYLSESRDGTCDRLKWDDSKTDRTIVKGFIELDEEPESVDAVDPVGGESTS